MYCTCVFLSHIQVLTRHSILCKLSSTRALDPLIILSSSVPSDNLNRLNSIFATQFLLDIRYIAERSKHKDTLPSFEEETICEEMCGYEKEETDDKEISGRGEGNLI